MSLQLTQLWESSEPAGSPVMEVFSKLARSGQNRTGFHMIEYQLGTLRVWAMCSIGLGKARDIGQ